MEGCCGGLGHGDQLGGSQRSGAVLGCLVVPGRRLPFHAAGASVPYIFSGIYHV